MIHSKKSKICIYARLRLRIGIIKLHIANDTAKHDSIMFLGRKQCCATFTFTTSNIIGLKFKDPTFLEYNLSERQQNYNCLESKEVASNGYSVLEALIKD